MFKNLGAHANIPQEGWSGYSKNTLAPPGNYVWFAEIQLFNDERIKLTGSTTLIR